VLERVSLAPLLDAVLTSAEAGVRKPAGEIFRRALELARAEPDQAIHVGDSLEEDVAGARNAGIAPVLVRRDGGEVPPGVVAIASLTELLETTP
jgi:putative hydrolase of the HAD superfamily